MEVKIENMIIERIVEMFFEMKLKGKKSRHRTKFIQFLTDKVAEKEKNEKQLLEEYCEKDENGELKANEEGTHYDIKDMDEYVRELQELNMEKVVFGGSENEETIKVVRDILDECEEEYSGYDATIYNHLCELFKVDEQVEFDE